MIRALALHPLQLHRFPVSGHTERVLDAFAVRLVQFGRCFCTVADVVRTHLCCKPYVFYFVQYGKALCKFTFTTMFLYHNNFSLPCFCSSIPFFPLFLSLLFLSFPRLFLSYFLRFVAKIALSFMLTPCSTLSGIGSCDMRDDQLFSVTQCIDEIFDRPGSKQPTAV